jgi:cytochrome c oxidase subunit II
MILESLVPSASTFAGEIDHLVDTIFLIVGVWFVVAEGIFFYFIFRFREKKGQKAQYITGNEHKHKLWIEVPHFLVLVCDVFLLYGAINVWYHVLPEPQDRVRIIGQQWAWTFKHTGPDGKLDTEDDITTTSDLHIKVNTVYNFELESKDVMHSFFVIPFRLKQDAIPGRTINGWFEATKTGVYDIQCAEMCGIAHGVMAGKIFIHSEEEYKQWMTAQAEKKTNTLVAKN